MPLGEFMCRFAWYPSSMAPIVTTDLTTFIEQDSPLLRQSRCLALFTVRFGGSCGNGSYLEAATNSIDGSFNNIYDPLNPTPPTFILEAKKNGIEPIAIGVHRNNPAAFVSDLLHLGTTYGPEVLASQWGELTPNNIKGQESVFLNPGASLNPLNPNGPGSEINPFPYLDILYPSTILGNTQIGDIDGDFLVPIAGCNALQNDPYIDTFLESGDTLELTLYTPDGNIMDTLVSDPLILDVNNTVTPHPSLAYADFPEYGCKCEDVPDEPDPDLIVYECRDGFCEPVTFPETDNYYGTLALCEAACNPRPRPGCTDPDSINYNPEATLDDGSCEYQPEDDPIGGGVTEINGTCTVDTVTVDPCNMLEMASLWAQQVSTGTGCHETILEELVLISALHDLTTRI